MSTWPERSDKLVRGILIMLGGTVLLLYVLGIIVQGVRTFLALAALGMILYGALEANVPTLGQQLIEKLNKLLAGMHKETPRSKGTNKRKKKRSSQNKTPTDKPD